MELMEQWDGLCQAELAKRGIPLYAGGHGWTALTIGVDPKFRMEYRRGEMKLTPEQAARCALMNGERRLKGKKVYDMTYTNFCMSQPELRSRRTAIFSSRSFFSSCVFLMPCTEKARAIS